MRLKLARASHTASHISYIRCGMKPHYTLLLILLTLAGLKGQERPTFISPIGGEIRLSGTFGELRSNHFHTGIDIKSRDGRGGDPILAAADGYLERIRISAVGYGRAIYIAHPNGYSTVYAHLDRFHPDIESRISDFQKKHHSAHFDLYPLAECWCVARGDTIGFMGNSGSSAGPHLHFEVRHTESETPINPLHWHFPYQKGSKPYARKLILYQFTDGGGVLRDRTYTLVNHMGDFKPRAGKLKVPPGRYGWAIQAIHPFNRWRNKNGLYALESYVNGTLHYAVCMDSLPFHLNRYINAHVDYPLYCGTKQSTHSLFARPHQEASCLRFDGERGTVLVLDSSSHRIEMELSGIEGTTSKVEFVLEGRSPESAPKPEPKSGEQVSPFQTYRYSDNYISFTAPSQTFYSSHPIRISSVCEIQNSQLLPTATVETDCHPFHKRAELRFTQATEWPDSLRDKVFVGRFDGGRWIDVGGGWEEDDFVVWINQEGDYRMCLPGPPPEIQTRMNTVRPGQRAFFQVKPQTESAFRIKDIRINIFYRNHFLPYSYDKKYQRVGFDVPIDWTARDTLKIVVSDRWGQSSTYHLLANGLNK